MYNNNQNQYTNQQMVPVQMYPSQQNAYPPQQQQQLAVYPPQQGNIYPGQQVAVYPPPMVQPQIQDMNQQNFPNTTCQSPYPVKVTCPSCNKVSTTNVTNKAGSGTYTCCFILCLFTGCCCIPFCVDSCQDKVHTCPQCQAVVGVHEYKPF